MEFKLHYPPEMPAKSGECLVFHYCVETGHITTVLNVSYSKEYGMFCIFDGARQEYFEERKESLERYNDSIIAWAYFDEVTQGVFDEIHG